METIYIKRQPNPGEPGGYHYVVPAVGIRAKEGIRLIPHPYGNETMTYDSLEKTVENVHRAGYSADFEGKSYPVPARQSAGIRPPAVRTRHKSALMNIIEAALPTLQEQLKDNNPSVVAGAANALGEMKSYDAIPGLIHALSHDDSQVRKSAAEALAKLGKPAMGAVQKALQDKYWVVRHSALTVLFDLIHMNIDLLPEILPDALPLLKDESPIVRSQAASVFGEAARIYQALLEKEQSASGGLKGHL